MKWIILILILVNGMIKLHNDKNKEITAVVSGKSITLKPGETKFALVPEGKISIRIDDGEDLWYHVNAGDILQPTLEAIKSVKPVGKKEEIKETALEETGKLIITVPYENAKIIIDSKDTGSSGLVRKFNLPSLRKDIDYYYLVTMIHQGKKTTKKVIVSYGKNTKVSF